MLRHLLSEEETNPDFISNGLWNFEKERAIAHILKKFQRCRTGEQLWKKEVNDSALAVQTKCYILECAKLGEEELSLLSKEVEPTVRDVPLPNAGLNFKTVDDEVDKRSQVSVEKEKLSADDWNKLLAIARDVNYKRHDPVIEEDAVNRFLYRVKAGEVRIEKTVV